MKCIIDQAIQNGKKPLMLCLCLSLHMSAMAADHFPQPPYSWRGIEGSGVFLAKDLVIRFWDLSADMIVEAPGAKSLNLPDKPGARKHIVWRSTLPFWGFSAPVVVGDLVFLTCDGGWKSDAPQLVCINAVDGRILWQQDVDHLDAWPADKAAEGKAVRSKDRERWRKYMSAWNRTFWDNEINGFAVRTAAEFSALNDQNKTVGFDLSNQAVIVREQREGGEIVNLQSSFKTWRSRCYWNYGISELQGEYKQIRADCLKHRYHVRPAWTAEGPYYDCTFPSPVSDGERVYAACPPDAVAGFDLKGHRLWVCDLGVGGRLGHYSLDHTDIASPVLADDKLLYWCAGHALVFGLDKFNGKILWKAQVPRLEKKHVDWPGGIPRGHEGHMGHGGTPVVMRLKEKVVVVAGCGVVVDVANGVVLGQIQIPKEMLPKDRKWSEDDDEFYYGSSYTSWVANGDVVFPVCAAGLFAVRLGIENGQLTQDPLWRFDGGVSIESPNLAIHGGRLYATVVPAGTRDVGLTSLNPETGQILARGPAPVGYTTNIAFSDHLAIYKTGKLGDQTESKADPSKTPGHGMSIYVVVTLPDLKAVGAGYLCPESPTGEIAERHIATIGTARIVGNNSGITAWGNRIFIRDSDYLWCIGDPEHAWVQPETLLKPLAKP